MSFHFLTLVTLTLLTVNDCLCGPDLPQKIYKKIARHHLNVACWGKRNTLQYYKTVKNAQEKCMRLTPTFDIDVDFDTNLKSNNGLFGPSQPSGSANGFKLYGNNPSGFSAPANNNPYDAWMAFLAFQKYQQQSGGYFTSNNPYANVKGRYQRSSHSISELAEFKEHINNYKINKKEGFGNLTCVLADMGVLDANLDINMQFYTYDAWNELDEPIDPEFRSRMIEAYEDCNTLSQAIPQSLLEKHPITKKFGRHLIFFKCAEKSERSLCAKQELVRWMEDLYQEPLTHNLLKQLGLPEDKFDAAVVAVNAMHSATEGPRKFVAEAIFGGADD